MQVNPYTECEKCTFDNFPVKGLTDISMSYYEHFDIDMYLYNVSYTAASVYVASNEAYRWRTMHHWYAGSYYLTQAISVRKTDDYFFPNTPVLSIYIDVVSALSIYVFTVFRYYVYNDITRLNANKILPHFLLTPERTYYAALKQIKFYVIAYPTVIQFDWMRYHCIRYCYLAKKLYSKLFGIFAINR